MPLQLVNLRIFQGDSYRLALPVADFDPTVGLLRAQIRDRWTYPGALYAEIDITVLSATEILLELDEAITTNLRATCSPQEMLEGGEALADPELDHLLWDLQQDISGTVTTRRSGRVYVPGEVTLLEGVGDPPPAPVTQWLSRSLADTLYAPLGSTGGGAADYERTFTQGDLSISGLLPVVHGLGSSPSAIAIYDPLGEPVEPDYWRVLSATTLEVSLFSFAPILGVWRLSVVN